MPLGHVPLHTSIRHRYLCCSDVDSESKKKKEKPKNKNRSFLDSAFFFFFLPLFFCSRFCTARIYVRMEVRIIIIIIILCEWYEYNGVLVHDRRPTSARSTARTRS